MINTNTLIHKMYTHFVLMQLQYKVYNDEWIIYNRALIIIIIAFC